MQSEKVLNDWFYPWQIYFDERLKEKVENFAKNLNSEEQQYYDFVLDFYSQYFSLQMLIDYIETNLDNANLAIKKAKENIVKILFIPARLKQNFIDKINSFNNKVIKDALFEMLEYALKSENKVDFEKYYSYILKENYLKIKSKIDAFKVDEKLELKSDTTCDVENIHNQFVKFINSEDFKNFWSGYIPKYDLIKKQALGYGEYWDADFFDEYKNNTLVIYQNENITQLDVLYTLFHEVYPGHGNFYELIKQNKNYVDLGAVLVIEGYATFCELNIGLDKDYEKYYLNKYYKFLKSTLNYNYENLDDYELLNAVNYPLYKENYYMGALSFIETIKSSEDLKNFYKKICSNNLTDLLIK